MKRILILLSLILLLSPGALCQDRKELKENRDKWKILQSGSQYICGEGTGATEEEADRQALYNLVTRINVTVTGEYSQVEKQSVGTAGNRSSIERSGSVRSYSNAKITNSRRMVLEKKKDFVRVGRWISSKEKERIYEDRKDRAVQFEAEALNAVDEGRLGDALRCHWWAYALIRSVPQPTEVRDSDGRILMDRIPDDMNRLLGSVTVSGRARDDKRVSLFFTSDKGGFVSGLDFSYFDGNRWVREGPVKGNGITIKMAKGALCEHIQLKIEYDYRDEILDAELYELVSSMKPWKPSCITIDTD